MKKIAMIMAASFLFSLSVEALTPAKKMPAKPEKPILEPVCPSHLTIQRMLETASSDLKIAVGRALEPQKFNGHHPFGKELSPYVAHRNSARGYQCDYFLMTDHNYMNPVYTLWIEQKN
jgi:hypothetical protein